MFEDVVEHPTVQALVAGLRVDTAEAGMSRMNGFNPGFDYGFNLTYGKGYTDADPLFERLHGLIDAGTREKIDLSGR
ncbi:MULTISPECIES: HD domain-containing protein 2 [Pseudomonas]|uniref:Uncharacterized protein n=1 Tax=Pseudomonas simiae TaxID=321846 RepID=A0A1N7U8V8_9PSED|nr:MULTISPECIES: HD domain-containing protein 2 [Pseudomonas]VVO18872.1 hypothetical protein PS708_04046 [Pseudomonas fluorescens]AIB37406.1 hypothetical protein PS417_17815 [Pseudomonas simiae]AJP53175.1 hypothetical protein PF1751_v1c34750 [Pseudomonas simiae]AJZ97245.1 hypothetical protein PFLUOLIPICF7_18530 [Pseudomonas simiae]UNK64556.1 hypothetical protein MNO08_17695 [Pseudomonas simiae]